MRLLEPVPARRDQPRFEPAVGVERGAWASRFLTTAVVSSQVDWIGFSSRHLRPDPEPQLSRDQDHGVSVEGID